MRKYALQVYCHDWERLPREDWVLMDDLPFAPLLLERMSAIGIIEPRNKMLSLEEVEKVQRILRLRQSLGVNLPGAAIIIELVDRLEAMEQEIEHQRTRKPFA